MNGHPAHESSDHTEMLRLRRELEQATLRLSGARGEIVALSEQCETLRLAAASQEEERRRAERIAERARERTARALAAGAVAGERGGLISEADELRRALEEISTLAEELQEANDALAEANETLDRRVTERTAALNQANAELERLNNGLLRRVEAEAVARADVQADLFRLQKLDAIGQLTGGIAHDFNNLLTVIISGLQLLGKLTDEERRGRLLRRTEEAAWRGANLTQRLLAFARRQTLHPDRLDVGRHMETIRELLLHALREDIALHVQIEPGLWPIEVDAAALELALLNLAVNARDAMPDGGTLIVSARNVVIDPFDDTPPAQLGLAPGDYAEIAVEDTGTGMSPELLQRVFEPFFTTKPSGKGTGLGLAQVYGFAKQSGGSACVESREREGTVVRLLLPRSLRAAAEQVESTEPEACAPPDRALQILVVEDDDIVAATVLDMLTQLGHHVACVSTVAAAMAVLNGAAAVNLVLSDVLLPGGSSGLDLAREISRQQLAIPVILTSGYGGGVTQRLAVANLPFLRKPYRVEALQQAIQAAMTRAVPAQRSASARPDVAASASHTPDQIAEAERHVRRAAELTAKQQVLVSALERDGHVRSMAAARDLLMTLDDSLKLARAHLRAERGRNRANRLD